MIYHYTTLEALAQILKNGTIRFSRLDQVDDLEEGRIESNHIKLSKHVFVSCWTESGEESIPLWRLYSGDKGGVRIGLEKNMFKDYYINNMMLGGQKAFGSGMSKVSREEMLSSDYCVFPIYKMDNSFFYRKVRYIDDMKVAMSDLVSLKEGDIEVYPNGSSVKPFELTIDMISLGAIKHRRWAFEEESRFSLMILPGNPYSLQIEQSNQYMIDALLNENCVGFTYYDMHLNPEVLNKIEITMSPSSLPGQRIIVESLCASYAPKAVIKESNLKNLVKMKG